MGGCARIQNADSADQSTAVETTICVSEEKEGRENSHGFPQCNPANVIRADRAIRLLRNRKEAQVALFFQAETALPKLKVCGNGISGENPGRFSGANAPIFHALCTAQREIAASKVARRKF